MTQSKVSGDASIGRVFSMTVSMDDFFSQDCAESIRLRLPFIRFRVVAASRWVDGDVIADVLEVFRVGDKSCMVSVTGGDDAGEGSSVKGDISDSEVCVAPGGNNDSGIGRL
mmetsp:Transcript_11129/g.13409  ORF Transcript_11129/g.13409 Transcript_11129/m.13409 type:complete len:112 (-) Transcript_11129:301-636(-)|eukprot:CAMPEP_0195252590 /NCGR_PEP_ID=MMETSP0706-20130129/3949_1 /TAXON_ID=33640 /ORGANISM="Asterionellopsis glacialis, Strain CCMP134" /LENGTH=111 /DNA_ID=CAMNT_0040304907 /DNA_START=189 /DNA_END=524 /DNA_ORIENTATION=+